MPLWWLWFDRTAARFPKHRGKDAGLQGCREWIGELLQTLTLSRLARIGPDGMQIGAGEARLGLLTGGMVGESERASERVRDAINRRPPVLKIPLKSSPAGLKNFPQIAMSEPWGSG